MRFTIFKQHTVIALLIAAILGLPSCRTAAYKAAISGDAVTMQRLVDEDASLNRKNVFGEQATVNNKRTINPLRGLLVDFPMCLFSLAWDIGTLGTLGTFSMIDRVSASIDETPVDEACKRGYADVMKILLNAGEVPSASSVQIAARNNHTAVILALIENNNIGPNWEYDDWPLLMWAARDNAPNVMSVLIPRGAFVNYRDDKGRTPLYLAAWNNNVQGARLLIAAGAEIGPVLSLTDDNANTDKGLSIVRVLQQAGAPASAFANHYLYGNESSALGLAVTRAGSVQPQVTAPQTPAVVAPVAPKRPANIKAEKPQKKQKAAPAPKPNPAPAAKPKQPSRASILEDFS